MTDPNALIGISMLVAFIFLIMLGFPIAFTLMGMGVGFGFYAYFEAGKSVFENRVFTLFVQKTFEVASNDVLIAVPLFTFMGYIIDRANILDRMFRALQLAIGGLPGSLAIATMIVCAIWGIASGIVGAVVVLMGLLAMPAMLRAGYDHKLSSGVICAGGTLGILIPPSVMLIVYGAVAGVSPVKLYYAAFIPGFGLTAAYIAYIVLLSMWKPHLAPKAKREKIEIDWSGLSVWLLCLGSVFFASLVLGPLFYWLATLVWEDLGSTGGLIVALVAVVGQALAFAHVLRTDAARKRFAYIVRELNISFLPLTILTIVVLGVIFFGIATPTESAAMGAVGALMLAIGYGADYSQRWRRVVLQGYMGAVTVLIVWALGVRFFELPPATWPYVVVAAITIAALLALWPANQFTLVKLKESVLLTARTTAMVCFLFVGSATFSSVFGYLGGQAVVNEFVQSLGLNSLGFMIVAQLIIFLLGWPLEWTEIIIIFVPIFLPLLKLYGIDPLFFGVMVALNLQTSFLSPPVAMAPFYLKGVAPPQVTINEIFRGTMPYIWIVVAFMVLMYVFPEMALWLPKQAF